MTAQIIPIDEPELGVAECLQSVIDATRDGHIVGVAIATIGRDGTVGSAWSDAPRMSALIGAVTLLQARLIASRMED